MKMKAYYISFLLVLFGALSATAQTVTLDEQNRDAQYVKTICDRSQKIVDKLGLTDGETALNVRNVIANRYFLLNDIYEKRDAAVKEAKEKLTGDAKNAAVQAAENAKDSELYRHHFELESNLSLFLNDEQIEAVKDGMTYGVVKVTYEAQCDMIPTLKDYEKKQILAWLKEAREYAMDAENSNKKHAAFGKYKGRSVAEVFAHEPSYYSWMMNGDFPLYTKRVITEIRCREKTK